MFSGTGFGVGSGLAAGVGSGLAAGMGAGLPEFSLRFAIAVQSRSVGFFQLSSIC